VSKAQRGLDREVVAAVAPPYIYIAQTAFQGGEGIAERERIS